MNQRVVGWFGFLEPNGETPLMIREAALELLINTYKGVKVNGTKPMSYGPNRRLRVDRHEQEWFAGDVVRSFALTTSQEVEEKLAMYRAPIAIAVSG